MQIEIAESMRQHSRNVRMIVRAGNLNRSEEHTSELQSNSDLVCRLLLEKKKMSLRASALRATTTSSSCHCSFQCSWARSELHPLFVLSCFFAASASTAACPSDSLIPRHH